jgi:hypothetical protein
MKARHLAFDLLFKRAEAGNIRIYGRKAIATPEGGWGKPATKPELIPARDFGVRFMDG